MTASITPLRRYVRHGTLPQLAALEAVVRLGSARRAAESLCIAQPTLSGQLRKLSDSLEVRLFELHGKRLVPTPSALALLAASDEVFAAFRRCERTLCNHREEALRPRGERAIAPLGCELDARPDGRA